MPLVLLRVLTVLGGLGFAAGISAGLWRHTVENAPQPLAEPWPVVVVATKGDRLEMPPSPAAVERTVGQSVSDVAPVSLPKGVREALAVAKATPVPIDRVCGVKGRYWFTRDRHRFWRCRR